MDNFFSQKAAFFNLKLNIFHGLWELGHQSPTGDFVPQTPGQCRFETEVRHPLLEVNAIPRNGLNNIVTRRKRHLTAMRQRNISSSVKRAVIGKTSNRRHWWKLG